MKLRKTKQEKLKATLKGILGDGPVQFEITKDGMSVRNAEGFQIFALKGKVKVDRGMYKECSVCNNNAEKLKTREDALQEREAKLQAREIQIREALKKLCND